MADFETTTDLNDCRVWAWGVSEIGNPQNFTYGSNIDSFMDHIKGLKKVDIYFHNLKFDGEFILSWLFQNDFIHVLDRKELKGHTFTSLISDKGQFYSMEVMWKDKGKRNKESITFYDSLKILPFSVDAIAKGFNLPIQKLEIDYHKKREPGHILTNEEVSYLKNDVEIVASALQLLFDQGLDKMTQGSNALFDYKRTVTVKRFKQWFPVPDYDADVRRAYRGGFTYLKPEHRGQDIGEGIVLDVNSLYPSVMYEKLLPYGEGVHFKAQYEDDDLYPLYVQALSCQFELKPKHIPTIQLKNNLAFIPTEYLESSGSEEVILYMTNIDLQLFKEHYDIYNIEYIGGWMFKATNKLFKPYITKWNNEKMQAKKEGNRAMYLLSKLMNNALYGKFALNPKVRSKIPYYTDGMVKYYRGEEEEREGIYIPVGTFVTSYSREKTIRAAQQLYDRFIYADTDSLHLIGTDIPPELNIDDVKLGLWSHESTFTRARFLRQKSYIEEIDGKLQITCAGLPASSYQYVTWDNFQEGAIYEGKLQPKRTKGGVVLQEVTFEIKSKR